MPYSIARDWPYPFWIAHRGAGHLAPENTLAAFRLGARYGYRMFECDAKLSSDGVVFLLHDTELNRTTNGAGVAGDRSWSELAQLDAGTWHSRSYAGETIPTLGNVARYCRANDWFVDIEIKPTPGLEKKTGGVVAELARHEWQGARHPPLLTSFRPESLLGARKAAPELPRGLLLDTFWDGWFDIARQLECTAVVCNHTLWNADTVAQAKAAGWRCLSYTVDDEPEAKRLIGLRTDGIVTNRVDLFSPAAH